MANKRLFSGHRRANGVGRGNEQLLLMVTPSGDWAQHFIEFEIRFFLISGN